MAHDSTAEIAGIKVLISTQEQQTEQFLTKWREESAPPRPRTGNYSFLRGGARAPGYVTTCVKHPSRLPYPRRRSRRDHQPTTVVASQMCERHWKKLLIDDVPRPPPRAQARNESSTTRNSNGRNDSGRGRLWPASDLFSTSNHNGKIDTGERAPALGSEKRLTDWGSSKA